MASTGRQRTGPHEAARHETGSHGADRAGPSGAGGKGGSRGRGGPPHVRMRRVYEAAEAEDGVRVLVDRIWPRGLAKDDARLDAWMKDVAPSNELRKWYGHDPDRYGEFAERYRAELAEPDRREALDRLMELVAEGPVTLLTATKDLAHSQARVLMEALTGGE